MCVDDLVIYSPLILEEIKIANKHIYVALVNLGPSIKQFQGPILFFVTVIVTVIKISAMFTLWSFQSYKALRLWLWLWLWRDKQDTLPLLKLSLFCWDNLFCFLCKIYPSAKFLTKNDAACKQLVEIFTEVCFARKQEENQMVSTLLIWSMQFYKSSSAIWHLSDELLN